MSRKNKIFYSPAKGDYIVASRCKCGHLESEHGSKTTPALGMLIRQPHAGNCCENDCPCERFTWESHVTLMEMNELVAMRSHENADCCV